MHFCDHRLALFGTDLSMKVAYLRSRLQSVGLERAKTQAHLTSLHRTFSALQTEFSSAQKALIISRGEVIICGRAKAKITPISPRAASPSAVSALINKMSEEERTSLIKTLTGGK